MEPYSTHSGPVRCIDQVLSLGPQKRYQQDGWGLVPVPAHGLRGSPVAPLYLTPSSCSVFY